MIQIMLLKSDRPILKSPHHLLVQMNTCPQFGAGTTIDSSGTGTNTNIIQRAEKIYEDRMIGSTEVDADQKSIICSFRKKKKAPQGNRYRKGDKKQIVSQ